MNARIPVAAALAAFLTSGCGGSRDVSRTHNVFGPDDRVPLRTAAYPYGPIGRLDMGCTATLIGPDVALTAAHCVVDETRGVLMANPGSFRPAYADGYAADAARIVEVTADHYLPRLDRRDDWAILRLDKRLGDRYGWMDVASDAAQRVYQGATVSLAGYSGDFHDGHTAGLHRGCRIRRDDGGLLHHDCDMTRGASGGPVFVMEGTRAVIVGVNVSEYRIGETSHHLAEYSEERGNQAVPARRFASRIGARPQDQRIRGVLGLELVYVGDDIGVKEAYEPCYAKIRRYVEIPAQSYMFPYTLTVWGTRDALRRIVDEVPCVDRSYADVGDDLEVIRRAEDYRKKWVDGFLSLEIQSSYASCYAEIERTVVITSRTTDSPALIDVRGRRDRILALESLACVRRAYASE